MPSPPPPSPCAPLFSSSFSPFTPIPSTLPTSSPSLPHPFSATSLSSSAVTSNLDHLSTTLEKLNPKLWAFITIHLTNLQQFIHSPSGQNGDLTHSAFAQKLVELMEEYEGFVEIVGRVEKSLGEGESAFTVENNQGINEDEEEGRLIGGSRKIKPASPSGKRKDIETIFINPFKKLILGITFNTACTNSKYKPKTLDITEKKLREQLKDCRWQLEVAFKKLNSLQTRFNLDLQGSRNDSYGGYQTKERLLKGRRYNQI